MKGKFRIVVVGIGGIGGFIGGKLAYAYHNSPEFEICFITRGENEKAIKENGLTLRTDLGEEISYPSIVTHALQEVGPADLLISCVKNFDLEDSLRALYSCISPRTIVIPLQNGLDAANRVRHEYPQTEVWEGCIYLVSRLVSPGLVQQSGKLNKVIFGSLRSDQSRLECVASIFLNAGISAELSADMGQILWEKFSFISPLASITSYLDLRIGQIITNDEHTNLLKELMGEIKVIAAKKGIPISEKLIQENINKMLLMPANSTSSMHADFEKAGKTELDSLVGIVVAMGKNLGVPTPNYQKIYDHLKKKNI